MKLCKIGCTFDTIVSYELSQNNFTQTTMVTFYSSQHAKARGYDKSGRHCLMIVAWRQVSVSKMRRAPGSPNIIKLDKLMAYLTQKICINWF